MTDYEKMLEYRRDTVKKLHSEGIAVKDIARQLGVSDTTVYKYIKDGKFTRLSTLPKGNSVLNPNADYADKNSRNRAIIELFYVDHWSLKDIAEQFGISVSGVSKTVSRHKDKYGY